MHFKSTTIPRLELAAAVEAVKLDQLLRKELQVPLQESVYWSESMIVLWYLQQEDKRYQTYVANRVAAIQEHNTPSQWRYVDSSSNPADDASRGMTAAEVVSTSRWIHGPPFLWKERKKWPTQPEFKCSMLEDALEVKPSIHQSVSVSISQSINISLSFIFTRSYKLIILKQITIPLN